MWKNATLKKYYMLISSFSVVTSIGYSKKFHQSEIIVPVHVDADEPKFPPHTGSNVSNFLCNLNIISSEEKNIRRLLESVKYCLSIFFVEFNNQRLGISRYEILDGLRRYLSAG